jgi:hypothetical protein
VISSFAGARAGRPEPPLAIHARKMGLRASTSLASRSRMDFRFRGKSSRAADITAMTEGDLYIGRLVGCRPTGFVDILRRRKALRLSIGGPHRRLFIGYFAGRVWCVWAHT